MQELETASLIAPDTCFLAFGSVAREEVTSKESDLDWALLVDGQAQESHLRSSQGIQSRLAGVSLADPGQTGLFGGPAFSHELIHCIGGEADSNRITTRRVLLLLESVAIGPGSEVRERVIRQLIKRYVEDDFGYRAHESLKPYVPRFLLNDLVRYWRTLAVDYAAKRRDREGKGWALRRLKLRMSRKLIFASGLATCMGCKLIPNGSLGGSLDSADDLCGAMTEHLLEFANRSPLKSMARAFLGFGAIEAGRRALGAYDDFLELLTDEDQRREIEGLRPEDARGNPLFKISDEIADRFQAGLSMLFFDTDDDLTRETQRYGVF